LRRRDYNNRAGEVNQIDQSWPQLLNSCAMVA
jgi:hypothetical protein